MFPAVPDTADFDLIDLPDDIPAERVRRLNDAPPNDNGDSVLYWMQASQRTRHNHALELAILIANGRKQPLRVCFGLTDGYPEANARHYAFMLEGLRDVAANLERRHIGFALFKGSPADVAIEQAKGASVVVTDMGYVRPCRAWRERVAKKLECTLVQVESGVVVPVETASNKREFAARTLRPKIHEHWGAFLKPVKKRSVKEQSHAWSPKGALDVTDPARLLESLKVDHDVAPSPIFEGGEDEAQKRLRSFLKDKLSGYADGRNEPSRDKHSYMSMYLHFGQISPIELALAAKDETGGEDTKSFLEELIVRRELAKNFVWFSPDDYDEYKCLPDWAQKTLDEHRDDDRPTQYTRGELEAADTDDPYWNAAMWQMKLTGFMHNYMRMYWGKKVLEWCNTPEYAYKTLLYLNNKFFIDGRDPNSFSNVAWVFGLHDRPWTERPIFGKTRYMNRNGLDRKFDMEAYVKQIDRLREEHE